jgi:c-di-GMP-related signal transduction protein
MDVVLERIPLDHETKAVLRGMPSQLRPVFRLILAHESGEWAAAESLSKEMNLNAEDAAGYYWQAQQWARDLSSGTND